MDLNDTSVFFPPSDRNLNDCLIMKSSCNEMGKIFSLIVSRHKNALNVVKFKINILWFEIILWVCRQERTGAIDISCFHTTCFLKPYRNNDCTIARVILRAYLWPSKLVWLVLRKSRVPNVEVGACTQLPDIRVKPNLVIITRV